MRTRLGFIVIAVLLILAGWLVWRGMAATQLMREPRATAVALVAATPDATTTSTKTVQPTQPPATLTPLSTSTLTPPQPPTAPATSLPSSTPTSTVTPTPPRGRACPEAPRLKPSYNRYFLPDEVWPTPNPALAASHFWLSKPLPGGGRTLINQGYPYGSDGSGRYLLHNGVDVAEDLGTPLLAVADGTVVVAQSDANAWYGWRCDWYGNLVVLELDARWHEQPVYALYGHVLNIAVSPGQRVQRGEPVAEIGIGGAAIAPHLHFEVRVGENEFDATRNPILWFDPGPMRGVIAGRLVDPEGRPWQGVALNLLSDEVETQNAQRGLTWSYYGDPDDLINPDEGLAENFVFADVPPGRYTIYTELQGVVYRVPVEVEAGALQAVEIVTEAFKTPTPTPPVTPTATAVDDQS